MALFLFASENIEKFSVVAIALEALHYIPEQYSL